MKTKRILITLASLVIASISQAAVVLSNLDNEVSSIPGITSNQFLAQPFQVGNGASGYSLDFIEIKLGNAIDTSALLEFWVYDNNAGIPGNAIDFLTTPTNPATAGNYTYTSTDFPVLDASVIYWIVGTTSGNGYYAWYSTENSFFTAEDNWSLTENPYYISNNSGASWEESYYDEEFSPASYLQVSISATAVPEPSMIGLLIGGGALAFALARKRLRRA